MMVDAWGCGGEGRMKNYCTDFQIYKMKRVMRMSGGDGCTTM